MGKKWLLWRSHPRVEQLGFVLLSSPWTLQPVLLLTSQPGTEGLRERKIGQRGSTPPPGKPRWARVLLALFSQREGSTVTRVSEKERYDSVERRARSGRMVQELGWARRCVPRRTLEWGATVEEWLTLDRQGEV